MTKPNKSQSTEKHMASWDTSLKVILTLILSSFVPVFLIDKPYTDDYARTIKGYFNWSNDGRPLSDLVVYIMNMGSDLTDISPLSYLLTIAFSIISCLIICRFVLRDSSLNSSSSACLVFLSPFYIQNLLYKYDCATMSLSILMCCIPFVDALKKGNKRVAIYSVVFVILSLSLYQASVPVFFCLCMIELIASAEKPKINLPSITFIRCFFGGLGIITYKFLIAPFFLMGDYGTERSELVPLNQEGFTNAISNIEKYVEFIISSISEAWAFVFIVVSIASVLAIALKVKNNESRFIYLIAVSASLSCILLSIIMFFLTKNPVYYPRIMVGFNALIMTMFCLCSICFKVRAKYIIRAMIAVILMVYFSQQSKILNFIKSSYNNEKQIALMMKIDMLNSSPNSELVIHGYPPLTIDSKKIKDQVPYVSGIYHPDLGWNTTRLFTDIETPFLRSQKGNYYGIKGEVCGLVVKKWNGIYTITNKEGKYHAVFRNEECL